MACSLNGARLRFHHRLSLALSSALAVVLLSTVAAVAQVAPTSTATVTGSVTDSGGVPISDAAVSLSGPELARTTTDAHGGFSFVGVPFGTYTVTVSSDRVGTASKSGVVVAGDTRIVVRYDVALSGLRTIAHLSTAAGATFNVSPVSVTVVHPADQAFQGIVSWRQILDSIPGVVTNGSPATVDTNAVTGSPFNEIRIAVNGALPYETAILLDDMPLIGDGTLYNGQGAGDGTDLSLYPLNSFSNADVIRGPSAAAPSIMNSIGGSIALQSASLVGQDNFLWSASNDPYGGIVSNARVGARAGKLSAIVVYGINDSPGPVNRGVLQPAYPLTVDGESFSCAAPNCTYAYPPAHGYQGYYGSEEASVFECCLQASSAWSQSSGSVALRYDFSDRLYASIFYAGQQSQGPLYGADFWDIFSPAAGYGYAGSLASGVYTVPYAYPNWLYGSGSDLVEEKIVAQIGNGQLRVAALQNRTYSVESYDSDTTQTLQLFGTGSLNGVPTAFNGGSYTVGNVLFTLHGWGRGDNRDYDIDYSLPLSDYTHVAFSYVQSFYDNPTYTSEAFGPPYSFSDTFSTSIENYQKDSEYRLLVGGNPTRDTTIDFATYFVNVGYHVQNPAAPAGSSYVDEPFTYVAPRMGFVWRPNDDLAVRASAGGGFAPAPLNDLVGSNGAPVANGSPPTSYSVTETNLNVKPEESFAFDVGSDLREGRTVYSLDVYRANLFGQVYESTSVNGMFNGLPLYTTKYGNLGVSRFEGILFSAQHSVSSGLYWSAALGLTRGYLVSVPAGFYNEATCTNCTNLYALPNINFNGEFEAAIPYSQGNATLGYRWQRGIFAQLTATYYGNNNSYYRPAFEALNGLTGIDLSRTLRLLVAFDNITGVYDRWTQVLDPHDLWGAPMLVGPAYALYPQEYGPRAVIVTAQFHS